MECESEGMWTVSGGDARACGYWVYATQSALTFPAVASASDEQQRRQAHMPGMALNAQDMHRMAQDSRPSCTQGRVHIKKSLPENTGRMVGPVVAQQVGGDRLILLIRTCPKSSRLETKPQRHPSEGLACLGEQAGQ